MRPTISVEIPDVLKKSIEERGVAVDEVVREALEIEVQRQRRERLSDRAAELQTGGCGSIDADETAELVRANRARRDR